MHFGALVDSCCGLFAHFVAGDLGCVSGSGVEGKRGVREGRGGEGGEKGEKEEEEEEDKNRGSLP